MKHAACLAVCMLTQTCGEVVGASCVAIIDFGEEGEEQSLVAALPFFAIVTIVP